MRLLTMFRSILIASLFIVALAVPIEHKTVEHVEIETPLSENATEIGSEKMIIEEVPKGDEIEIIIEEIEVAPLEEVIERVEREALMSENATEVVSEDLTGEQKPLETESEDKVTGENSEVETAPLEEVIERVEREALMSENATEVIEPETLIEDAKQENEDAQVDEDELMVEESKEPETEKVFSTIERVEREALMSENATEVVTEEMVKEQDPKEGEAQTMIEEVEEILERVEREALMPGNVVDVLSEDMVNEESPIETEESDVAPIEEHELVEGEGLTSENATEVVSEDLTEKESPIEAETESKIEESVVAPIEEHETIERVEREALVSENATEVVSEDLTGEQKPLETESEDKVTGENSEVETAPLEEVIERVEREALMSENATEVIEPETLTEDAHVDEDELMVEEPKEPGIEEVLSTIERVEREALMSGNATEVVTEEQVPMETQTTVEGEESDVAPIEEHETIERVGRDALTSENATELIDELTKVPVTMEGDAESETEDEAINELVEEETGAVPFVEETHERVEREALMSENATEIVSENLIGEQTPLETESETGDKVTGENAEETEAAPIEEMLNRAALISENATEVVAEDLTEEQVPMETEITVEGEESDVAPIEEHESLEGESVIGENATEVIAEGTNEEAPINVETEDLINEVEEMIEQIEISPLDEGTEQVGYETFVSENATEIVEPEILIEEVEHENEDAHVDQDAHVNEDEWTVKESNDSESDESYEIFTTIDRVERAANASEGDCKLNEVCYSDKECGSGRCLGMFVGKCSCDACMNFLTCSDDSACGGLKNACNVTESRCNCIEGHKENGFPLFIDALRELCNVKDCDATTDTCFGLPCRSGRCVC